MNHLDTFSGIGGWALAARWMGWKTLAFVEQDKFCTKVLNKNFPEVPVHDDIFTFSGKPFRGRVGILTGSTPCQPFSQAGKRKGSNDDRHLFPEFLRVVAEVRPQFVVIENVFGLLNIENGDVFETYNTSLEGEGYSVQTFCIPASALGAPHRRDRLWIVANNPQHPERDGLAASQVARSNGTPDDEQPARANTAPDVERANSDAADAERLESGTGLRETGTLENGYQSGNSSRTITDPGGPRLRRGEQQGTSGKGTRASRSAAERDSDDKDALISVRCNGQESEGESNIGRQRQFGSGNGVWLPRWDRPWPEVAAEFCRMDDVVPNRVDRLKSLGNAIVPSIAFEIFKAIASTASDET